MSSIKIINNRSGGTLFHYAHFISDCLYPEVILEFYKKSEVYRLKTLDQTIGNFVNIYNDVLLNKSIELEQNEFDQLDIPIRYTNKLYLSSKRHLDIFRDYIFTRYNISPKPEYPKILLIKRADRIPLISDPYLNSINTNFQTGKERREIKDIEKLEELLFLKYSHQFKSIYLEHTDFSEQIKLFNNAKLIILSHGAALVNAMFCTPSHTKLIEVDFKRWLFFDTIFNNLQLTHIGCSNNFSEIVDCININQI
jgi:hypothetical protein